MSAFSVRMFHLRVYENDFNKIELFKATFEILTAVTRKIAAFWHVTLCNEAETYQRFRGTYLRRLPEDTSSSSLWKSGNFPILIKQSKAKK
jgi:hypothetical protein